jgi:hypothetical protein
VYRLRAVCAAVSLMGEAEQYGATVLYGTCCNVYRLRAVCAAASLMGEADCLVRYMLQYRVVLLGSVTETLFFFHVRYTNVSYSVAN